ncbi:MAG TPA: glutamate--tRNA ligase, partial [Patescibacteria group bacterium]
IAPSPTGIPHIGNTRTALFNWLFARANNGKFIVRVEDTDRQRLVEGSLEKILEILEFLGLDWNEGPKVGGDFGPYIQSERKDLYQKYAKILVEKGMAYEDEGAVRFKVEKGKIWKWDDQVHGEISFKSDVLEDFVILKSDGFPTYHLAVVVDDNAMKISHVLRGDEWISSTPKHLMLYSKLGWKPPVFGHLPLILGPDKSKLSKRHGAQSVLDYRDEGYLAESLINFMALLGWSPKDNQEILSLEVLIKKFDLKDVNTTNPIFNRDKLDWFNRKWIKKLSNEDLYLRLQPFIPKDWDKNYVVASLDDAKERMTILPDFATFVKGEFERPKTVYVKRVAQKPEDKKFIKEYLSFLGNVEFISGNLETKSLEFVKGSKLDLRSTFMLVRRIVLGADITLPLFSAFERMGKEEVLERLKNAI